ncbi:allantoinase AllB [Amycolatopsis pithecellobii]|uniref:allantoinase n=1 Tax=Amycolatopsis pithecellobii TaxID=664692 RepID=A0A6N7Z1Z6_9PSEU|nr:allantoinase AllB [Amycolatopsis pithecellobii]MTD52586.1 allantoinase AllB [Amycolatopsis pithecellobii]
MTSVDLVIRAARAVTAAGETPATIAVSDGRIAGVEPFAADIPAHTEVRLDADVVLLPGLVDTHVHLQDPGRDAWEGFESGTRAAAAGGITTVVDMPLDSLPVTVTPQALAAKRAAAANRSHVDVGFWGGVTPGNLHRLPALRAAGVLGFKCFLADSGTPEFPPITPAQLGAALTELAGTVVLVHAEWPEPGRPTGGTTYRDFLDQYPVDIETRAVACVLEVARRTRGRVHLVHVASGHAASMIAKARRDGIAVTAETCPHYLTFSAPDIPDEGTEFKVCPPIREPADRDQLWRALESGALDMIVSDHSPSPAAGRSRDFASATAGISSLQLSLPVTWTAAKQRGIPLARLADWMSAGPAHLAGLATKGRIAAGKDADFCVLAPDERFVVDPAALAHRQRVTPYAGKELFGVVRETWLRGERVSFSRPRGRLLVRGNA